MRCESLLADAVVFIIVIAIFFANIYCIYDIYKYRVGIFRYVPGFHDCYWPYRAYRADMTKGRTEMIRAALAQARDCVLSLLSAKVFQYGVYACVGLCLRGLVVGRCGHILAHFDVEFYLRLCAGRTD